MTVSWIMVVLKFSEPERWPTYVGIGSTVVGVASLAGPMLATGPASIGANLGFAPSVAFSAAAWAAIRWWVAEPRWAARPEA